MKAQQALSLLGLIITSFAVIKIIRLLILPVV
jgi:hypothetical protein